MSEPEILYHYTTAMGLLGIVQSQTLWATNADFLNDAQELQFGRQQVRDALLREADKLSPIDSDDSDPTSYSRATVMRSAAAHFAPGLELVARDHQGSPVDDPFYAGQRYHFAYVACFCEDGDLLSQWRGYGAAGGYAVGFHAAALRLAQLDQPERVSRWEPTEEAAALVRVRDGDAAVKDAIADVLGTIAPAPTGHPGVTGYSRAQSVVLPALAGIKHAAFAEEREWRLTVVTDAHTPSFRIGPLRVTPYITLRYPPDTIAEVVVGPGPEPELRAQRVQLLVGSEIAVRSSDAPFRG